MRTLRYTVAMLYAVLAYVVPLDRPEASPPARHVSVMSVQTLVKPTPATWPLPKRSPLERFAR